MPRSTPDFRQSRRSDEKTCFLYEKLIFHFAVFIVDRQMGREPFRMPVPELQSHLRFPLNRLLGNVGNVRVLRALVTHGAPLSASQLARETALTPQGTRGVIGNLLDQQAVVAFGQARTQLFAVNPQFPLLDVLRSVFEAERRRWERIIEAVRRALMDQPSVEAGWYYGSVARGEDGPASDLDIALLVVGAPAEEVVESVRSSLQPVEDALLFGASVVGLTDQDVLRMAPNDPWWRNMSRDAKAIVGPLPAQLGVAYGHAEQSR